MKRIAVICPPAMGHVFPSLALAGELRDRGHEIVFLQVASLGRNVERIECAGFECHVYGSSVLQRDLNDAYARLGHQQGLQAFRTMVGIVEKRVTETISQLASLFSRLQIDCALIDRLMPGATAVARGVDLPFASVSNALILQQSPEIPPCFTRWKPDHPLNRVRNYLAYEFYSHSTRSILKVVNDYRTGQGLRRVESFDENLDGATQLSQQPEFFTFPRKQPVPNLHFCGPFINSSTRTEIDFPWDRLSGKPLIYLSLGTLQNRTSHIFRIVAEACAKMDVDLVLSTGGAAQRFESELPGRPIVARFVPQLELLKKASLCITHAGLNTTLESLAAGVPMIAIPIANDQPGVAARLDYHGYGRSFSASSLSVLQMRSTIRDLLDNEQLQANLANARKRLLGANGCRVAADRFERQVVDL